MRLYEFYIIDKSIKIPFKISHLLIYYKYRNYLPNIRSKFCMKRIKVELGKKSYDILIGSGIVHTLPVELNH